MTRSTRARIQLAAGLLLAGVALWFAFAEVSFGDFMRATASASVAWLAVSVASIFGTVALVVTRLRALLAGWALRPAWNVVWNVTIVGQVANILMPFRLGDAAKVVAGQRSLALPTTAMGAVVVVERLFDLMALSVVAGVLLVAGSVPGWAEAAVLVVTVTGFGLIVAVLTVSRLALKFSPEDSGPGWRRWLRDEYLLLREGLGHTSRAAVVLRIAAMSVSIASASILTNFIVMHALHLSVPFSAAALLWVILQCGNTLLPAPGGIGTSQLLTITTLNLWAVPDASGLACSVLIYLISRVPKIALFPVAMSALDRPVLPTSAKA